MTSMLPEFVPAEWEPVRLTRKQYNDQRAHLLAQVEAQRAVVAAYQSAYAAVAASPLGLDDAVGTAFDAAHDALTALEYEVDHLDRAWSDRKTDPYQRFLVANNID